MIPRLVNRAYKLVLQDISQKFNRLYQPSNISIGIAETCNFKCKQCDIWKIKDNRDGVSTEEKLRVLKELKDWLGNYSLGLSGSGEPLIKRDEVYKICKYTSQNNIYTSMNSNGFLITEKVAEKLVNSGLNKIIISIDSLDPEIHDYLRGVPSAHKRAMEAVGYLKKYSNNNFSIVIQSVLLNKNLKDSVKLAKWAKENDIPWSFQCLEGKYAFGGDESQKDWSGDDEFAITDFSALRDTLNEFKKLHVPDFLLEDAYNHFKNPDSYLKGCAVGLNNLIIDSYGEVKLCWLKDKIGDIDDGIRDLWKNSESAGTLRKDILQCKLPCSTLHCNRWLGIINLIKQKIR